MLRRKTNLFACLALLVALQACSFNALFLSGEMLDATGKQFVKTANLYKALHASRQITTQEYDTWKAFGRKFKLTYGPAVKAWVKAADRGEAADAADAVIAIKDELLAFVLAIESKIGGK